MLANWAENIIVPGYQNYVNKLDELTASANSFNANPSEMLYDLEAWLSGYLFRCQCLK